jgi:hypothetical protein
MTILTAIDADPGCKEVIETAHELATGLDMELVITHRLYCYRITQADRSREDSPWECLKTRACKC